MKCCVCSNHKCPPTGISTPETPTLKPVEVSQEIGEFSGSEVKLSKLDDGKEYKWDIENLRKSAQAAKAAEDEPTLTHTCLCGKHNTPEDETRLLKEWENFKKSQEFKDLINGSYQDGWREGRADLVERMKVSKPL